MATKVLVDYPHEPDNLDTIYLAITTGQRPAPDQWQPALRDTIDGKRVVWARFPTAGRRVSVWVRDRSGEKQATTATV
ncbi:MAG TPA: hypothetical protein VK053_07125 [Jiangellaceae bacterium]|nr:hypothetical protein [Jiangellaceae bacterium]